FLRSSFQMPEHSLSARQIARHMRGTKVVTLATTTRSGEPRATPVGSLFYRARFHVPTVRDAARSRHVSQRPAVSLTYYEGVELAIIVHGQASILDSASEAVGTLEEMLRAD